MRIIIWTASYPPDLGGLQTVVKQLADQLAGHGHQVLVIANHRGYKSSEELQDNGVKVIRLRHWSGFGQYTGWKGAMLSFADLVLGYFVRNKLNQIIKQFNPDIINIHFPTVQLKYTDILKAHPQIRKVISLHGHDVTYWLQNEEGMVANELRTVNANEKWRLIRLQELLIQAEATTACSSWLLSLVSTILTPGYQTKSKWVTYNAIDLSRFTNQYRKPVPFDYLFAFGRMDRQKGFHLLIDAFAIISKEKADLQLVIGGSGTEQELLYEQAKYLGLSKRIIFTGRLSPEEVVAYAQYAQLIVVPSLRETFGITVLEALASGRPVVASHVGGIPEAAGDFVTLCEPGNVNALVEAITSSINNQVIINNNQRIRHLETFDLKSFYSRYAQALGIDH